jgi:DNA repair protein RecO (recombination protein O)
MDERAIGLVLRVYPLTESSLIVHWLTQGQGRIATVAKGARRPKSTLRGKLDLFFLAEFLFSRSRRSELHTLKEVKLIEAQSAFGHDLSLLHRGRFAGSGTF